MKKISFLLSILSLSAFVNGQEKLDTEYNKWSIEANGGINKARKSLSAGFNTESPSFYHVDLGVRYMFNNKFGLKLDGGYDRLKEGKEVERFRTNYYRVDLQAVVNAARILNFETWTKTIGLLAHGGGGYSWMNTDDSNVNTDHMGNVMIGLTPQIKLTESLVLNGDVSYIRNIRQDNTFNGTKAPSGSGFGGEIWNATLGFTYYIGKHNKHIDWAYENSTSDLEQRINNIEIMLIDSDGDGVPDYLDQELDSKPGAVVDTRGVTIDHNGNGIPDNIEEYIKEHTKTNSTTTVNDSEFLEQMINSGIINVYFDYNSDVPYKQSIGGIKFVSEFLKSNPNAKIEILGYADPTGGADYNKKLAQRRADNVKKILINQGASASQLIAVSEGIDTDFKNSQNSSLQLARRVVFKIK